MFSQVTVVLLFCYVPLSTTLITIYHNAQFVPINANYKLADIFSMGSQNECACQCFANVRCLTATYVGINQTCSLFTVQLRQNWLRLVTTIMSSSVLSFNNKSTPIVNFTEMYAATPQPTANYSYLNAIAMGDLNGDSMIDMAAVYRNSNNFVVWLGYGNGTFSIGQPYTTDANPFDLSIVDMTGDGKRDILVLCYGSSTINLFVNRGGGTFAAKLVAGSTGSSSYPFQMAVADINGNGLIDVIAATWNSPFVSIQLNLGYGNWTQFALVTNTSYPFNGSLFFPLAAVVSNFNQDSFLDVAVVAKTNIVAVLLGKGDGRLNAPTFYTTGDVTSWVSRLIALDANGDGNMDVAVTNAGGISVAILFGDGQGHLSTPTLYTNSAAPSVMCLGDANQDGYSDLLYLSGGNCYALLLGSANGSFTQAISCGAVSIGYVTGLGVGDINNDGILDMAIGATGSSNIEIFLGSIG